MSITRLKYRFIVVRILVMVSSVILGHLLILKHLHSMVIVCDSNVFDVLIDDFHGV